MVATPSSGPGAYRLQLAAVWARLFLVAATCLTLISHSRALDSNSNQMSDIWEMIFNAHNLAANSDSDGDAFTNFQESLAATDPLNPLSRPSLNIMAPAGNAIATSWRSAVGKLYDLQVSNDLIAWQSSTTFVGDGSVQTALSQLSGQLALFFHLSISDQPSESPQLSSWEKLVLGFDPASAHTDRYDQTDLQRITTGLAPNASNVITVSAIKPEMSERWPEPGVITVRRSGGGLKPLTVNLAISGTATLGTDYSLGNATATSVFIPAGVREVWINFLPLQDANDAEPPETITVTLQSAAAYTLGSNSVANVSLANETANSPPSPKAAARFLLQAAFGPDGLKPSDVNGITQNVAEVMQLGFAGWINDQFARPICKLEPFVNYANGNGILGGDNIKKQTAWWNRAMGVTKIRPDDANTVPPDFLRQRVGFALSQLFVVSDRPETLAVQPGGLANYYDMLLNDAFGNFRTLLFNVTLHPVMGVYLSHLLNKKAANNIFPDENYAREVMQLFSIGLWKLNQDGTRQLDAQGQPIPTYNNFNITEFARVFTGLGYAGNSSYSLYPQNFLAPMKLWDTYHDCDPKTLLNGVTLPARTPSNPDVGTATLADINDAIDCLFNHPNVGPFIGRQLIERLVTSNPSPGYISRVAAAFANNGQGVRGDMKAVIKAILLDTEARDPAKMSEPTFGKLREPFLRCVNLAHAFNASAQAGFYALDAFYMDHVEEPMRSPSVFNFYLPGYSPPGMLNQAGLFAPEFQIINAGSAITAPNYFFNAIRNNDLHRWGSGVPAQTVRLSVDQELAMIVPAANINKDVPPGPAFDSDPLLRRLDFALTGGTLSPRAFQTIRESIERIGPGSWQWHRDRLALAIYLIVTSPEFAVQR
jgi:uncharacterized protein (DUF1800 family)